MARATQPRSTSTWEYDGPLRTADGRAPMNNHFSYTEVHAPDRRLSRSYDYRIGFVALNNGQYLGRDTFTYSPKYPSRHAALRSSAAQALRLIRLQAKPKHPGWGNPSSAEVAKVIDFVFTTLNREVESKRRWRERARTARLRYMLDYAREAQKQVENCIDHDARRLAERVVPTPTGRAAKAWDKFEAEIARNRPAAELARDAERSAALQRLGRCEATVAVAVARGWSGARYAASPKLWRKPPRFEDWIRQ